MSNIFQLIILLISREILRCLAETSQNQIIALNWLYNSTFGERWSWKNEEIYGPQWSFPLLTNQPDPCNTNGAYWQGIICSAIPNFCSSQPCEIISLILDDYGLDGSLPTSFFQITSLTSLKISNSRELIGPIPTTVGALVLLEDLDLSWNNLQGPLPSALGDLIRLTSLILENNGIDGILPSEIGFLSHLLLLDISLNLLNNSIPNSFGFLAELTNLRLSYNYLTGPLPSTLGSLGNLKQMLIEYNEISGTIPSSLGSLSLLQFLTLDANDFIGTIPPSLGCLTQLQLFSATSNCLIGSIPDSLGELSELLSFSIDINFLTGTLPSSLGQWSRLQVLSIDSNQLSGDLPSSFGLFSDLKSFFLYNNRFSGPIPSSFGELSQIEYLYFQNNHFTGTIPSALGSLSKIRFFYVYDNSLSGTLPSSLGSLSSVEDFSTYSNFLSGSLPSSLASLTGLELIYIFDNYFSGSIPSYLGNELTLLQYLSISFNQFTAAIPSSLGNLSSLRILAAYSNSLSGPIPSSLGSLSILQLLQLDRNFLSSSIPFTLGSLQNLETLEIQENVLTGTLPESLNSLMQLTYLQAYSNHLTGSIPLRLESFPSLQLLFLHRNQFIGSLHQLFASNATGLHNYNSSHLFNLDVSDNHLTGSLPAEIFQLPSLLSVSLSLNCFENKLPDSMCSSRSLEVLSMDGLGAALQCKNSFKIPFTKVSIVQTMEGSIPECLWSSSQVREINLAGNGFQGSLASKASLPSLINLTLSHNHLTGVIPVWLQEKNLTLLDLSHNRFFGDLSSFRFENQDLPTAAASDHNRRQRQSQRQSQRERQRSLFLTVNRLSGSLSHSFDKYSTLQILSGNVFSCGSIPKQDKDSEWYTCGSIEFDRTIYLMGSILVMSLFLFFLFYLSQTLPLAGDAGAGAGAAAGDGDDLQQQQQQQQSIPSSFSFSSWLGRRRKDFRCLLGYLYYCQRDWTQESRIEFIIFEDSQRSQQSPTEPQRVIQISQYPLHSFAKLLYNFWKSVMHLTAVILLLSTPLYVLKAYDLYQYQSSLENQDDPQSLYITHTHQYSWLITIAYLSGTLPGAILLIICFSSSLVYVFSLRRIHPTAPVASILSTTIPSSFFHPSSSSLASSSLASSSLASSSLASSSSAITAIDPPDATRASVGAGTSTQRETPLDSHSTQTTLTHDSLRLPQPSHQQQQQHQLLLWLLLLLNFIAVGTVNGLYIWSTLIDLIPIIRSLIQLLLSLFTFLWGFFLVFYLPDSMKVTPSGVWFLTWVNLLNNVLIPCLVTALTSPTCYQRLLIEPNPIISSYSYSYCKVYFLTPSLTCVLTSLVPMAMDSLKITPLFVYSYQCGSTLLVAYLPVYMYTITLQILTNLSRICFIFRTQETTAADWDWDWGWDSRFKFFSDRSNMYLPGISWPESTLLSHLQSFYSHPHPQIFPGMSKPLINSYRVMISLSNKTLLLLSFGLCSPILCIYLFLSLSIEIYCWLLLLGRYGHMTERLLSSRRLVSDPNGTLSFQTPLRQSHLVRQENYLEQLEQQDDYFSRSTIEMPSFGKRIWQQNDSFVSKLEEEASLEQRKKDDGPDIEQAPAPAAPPAAAASVLVKSLEKLNYSLGGEFIPTSDPTVDSLYESLHLCKWPILSTSCFFLTLLCWNMVGDQMGWFASLWVPLSGLGFLLILRFAGWWFSF